MSLTLAFSISLFLSIALVPFFIRHSAWLGLVDIPDGIRKIHKQAIPRCGGLAIALAALLPSLYFAVSLPLQIGLLSGAMVIVFFGFLDDKYDLDFRWKFVGQILAAMLFINTLPELTRLPFFLSLDHWSWLGYVGVFVFILGATNAVNLSDGLDGLAGGTILLSLALLAYLAYLSEVNQVALVAIALIGALLGFLRYNTHPATVFMGDAGSQFIGFTAAALSILLTQDSNCAISPVLPLLIVGLPLIDTAMVMTIRMREGRSPFSADKNHIHHQLMRFGFHHYEAVAIIYLVQVVFVSLAFSLRYSSDGQILVIYLVYAGLLVGTLFGLRRLGWVLSRERGKFIERRNPILRRLGFLHDYGPYALLAILAGFWLTLLLTNAPRDTTLPWLAVVLLLVAFVVNLIKPSQFMLITRLVSYSVCVLTLYPHWIQPSPSFPDALADGFVVAIGLLLALTITVTRRENFRLDNQDILMLVLLLAASLMPVAQDSGLATGDMMVRLVVMLYAVEFLLNSLAKRASILYALCVMTLFALALNL